MTPTTPPTTTPKPRRRWLQFSLRTMLVLVLLLGCGFGYLAHKIKQAKERYVIACELEDARVGLSREPRSDERLHYLSRCRSVLWLPDWTDGLFLDVTGVSFVHRASNGGSLSWITRNPNPVSTSLNYATQRLPGLCTIRLAGTLTTDTDLASLRGLSSLDYLDLRFTAVSDRGLSHLQTLPSLRQLRVGNSQVTDEGLAHLEEMHQLRYLALGNSFNGLANIVDRTSPDCSAMKAARKMFPWRTRITDAGLVHLRGLVGLEELELDETQITDGGLASLKGLTQLKRLDLGCTQITDAGLVHLCKLTQLETLYLDGTEVTDAGLVTLGKTTRLQVLMLKNTHVTEAGIRQLNRALPECEIYRRS